MCRGRRRRNEKMNVILYLFYYYLLLFNELKQSRKDLLFNILVNKLKILSAFFSLKWLYNKVLNCSEEENELDNRINNNTFF